MTNETKYRIERDAIDRLIQFLAERGYTVVAPTVRNGAILYDEVHGIQELPVGWSEEQEGAMYRLVRRADEALFGYTVGPQSWKKFLFPPRLKMLTSRRNGKQFVMEDCVDRPVPAYAFLGVRACEIEALRRLDKILGNDRYPDLHYVEARKQVFIVAVNCTQAAATCFCASMNSGPKVDSGYDLALTEVLNELGHFFVVDVGSERGASVLKELSHRPASELEIETADHIVEFTSHQMGRFVETEGIRELLRESFEHPHWENIAQRCMTCANCTMVCPTCFCTTVEDVTDLSGDHAERWRRWDSCFTIDFSYIHGGSLRTSGASRYRQWLTHKFGTWIDQFGSSGCVGCGRCITWCPVGIDVTAELDALRTDASRRKSTPPVKEKAHGQS